MTNRPLLSNDDGDVALATPAHDGATHTGAAAVPPRLAEASPALGVLIVVPTLETGAAEHGAVELARVLSRAGHRVIVAARGGPLEVELAKAGVVFIERDAASKNPVAVLRNAFALAKLARAHRCDVIHAHGRVPAWSANIAARMARVPLITSWYKGFREQNLFKRFYNRIMVSGVRVVAAGDQLAELINDRYGTSWERIAVIPASVDTAVFDPSHVTPARIHAMRLAWGAGPQTRVVLVLGRMVRRKGHHLAVRAACRLKHMGLKDFLFVFAAAEGGMSHYACETWDQVLAANAADVCRIVSLPADRQAAFAAATIAISAAVQPEGTQRGVLEALAMGLPIVASDVAAGPDIVLAPPAVTPERMTGIRFSAGNEVALTAAVTRMLALSDGERQAIGCRGRDWVAAQFAPAVVSERMLRLYRDIAVGRPAR